MTLRARPVARRRGRAGWDSGDRRNTLINAGFFIAIGLAVLILLGYAAWSWYDGHFGAAAVVNGQVITKDDLRNRLAIENFRLDYIESRIKTLEAKGRISSADAQQQVDFLSQRRQQLTNLTLQRLVDGSLMAKLAADDGIAVTDTEVDAQLVSEATTSEQRHVWMIAVEPATDPATGQVGEAQKRAALVRAQQAFARLKNGESWDDVARTMSTSGLAPQSGDLGWLSKDSGYEADFMTAVFAAELNAPTTVIQGADGTYRIGRYTELAAQEVDANLQPSIVDIGIKLDDYRAAARADVVRKKLSDKVVADMSKPGPQRHVLQIYLPEPNAPTVTTESGVKVRHILFAPNDDASKAASVPATDPAWARAKAAADATYVELKAHPNTFDALARGLSDEPSAKTTGGKQPWYYPSSSLEQAFKDAIFAAGLTPGQLLQPVKTAFGWHVIQIMRPTGDGDAAWLAAVKAKVTDDASFKQLAKDNSEGPEAQDGGDIGWIAPGQLADKVDAAIFGTAVGSLSAVITIDQGGVYLMKVLAEETRTPTDAQLKIFKDSGFSYWYTRQKEKAKIDYPLGTSSATG
jgi:parvulin-like peptidyl-prolyl isomerase